MNKLVLRNSTQKRTVITLFPLFCFLNIIIFGLFDFFELIEHTSFVYDVYCFLLLLLFFAMIIGLPFTIKVNREKIKYDGYFLYVTPFIGFTKTVALVDVRLAVIDEKNWVKLFNEKGKKICRYPKERDEQEILLNDLKRAGVQIIEYSHAVKYMLCLPPEDQKEKREIKDYGQDYLEVYGFKEKIFEKEDIDTNIVKALEKSNRRILVVSYIAMLAIYGGLVWMMYKMTEFLHENFILSMCTLVFYVVIMGTMLMLYDRFTKWRKYDVLKSTYYKVEVKPVGMRMISTSNTASERHMLYEFADKNGEVRHRLSDVNLPKNVKKWEENNKITTLWFSPYSDYLISDKELSFSNNYEQNNLSFFEKMKKNPIGIILVVAVLAIFMFGVTYIQKEESYKPVADESPLKVEWADESQLKVEWEDQEADLSQEAKAAIDSTGMDKETYEKWLKQTYYPYFCVNGADYSIFSNFNVETYNDDVTETRTEQIRENIKKNWGITNRKTLIEKTDSLLDKGAKYGYQRTINRMGEEELNMSEEEIEEKYGERDSYYQYLGCYLAHQNLPKVGVDAWDYCRCIRLYACGYICGYISYDEYLIHSAPIALQLQKEFDSWTEIYESQYYGNLYFLGRNEYTHESARTSGYARYEHFESDWFVPLKSK